MNTADIAMFDFRGRQLRTVVRDGEPHWVLMDLCGILGYTDAGQVTRWLDADDYTTAKFEDVFPGKAATALDAGRRITLVSEPGLYELIFRSARQEARAFKRWVTAEVLPTIRRTGTWREPGTDLATTLATDPDTALDLIDNITAAARELRARNRVLATANQQLADEHVVLAPKAAAYDAWFDTDDTCSVRDAARMLQRMFHIGENELRERMRRRWRWLELHSTAATRYATRLGYMINYVHVSEFGPCPSTGRLTSKGLQRAEAKLRAELPADRHLAPPPSDT